jgi:LemA protein
VQSGFKVPLSRSSSFALAVNRSATVSRYVEGNNKGERTMLLTMALVCLGILALLVAVPAYIAFATHNRLVALDQRCETAFGDVDVHLKHRHNLIPPLVEMVRGFAKHENDILLGVAKARAEALEAASPEMQLTAEKNLTQNINALIGVAERYPELKASTHFSELRRELVDAENRITASRRFYNLAVEEYDTTLRQFPGSYIGRLFKMHMRTRFDLGIERVLIDEPLAVKF